MKLLVIEDSPRLRRSLGRGLKKLGYSVDLVGDGREGLDYGRFNDYDVIVLDLMLPGMDGLTVLKELRSRGKQCHILILSARDGVEDRVNGLDMGADDYLVKPFSFDELCARIGSLTRRRYEEKNPELRLGTVRLNTARRTVACKGAALRLTPAEYALLEYLALNRGRTISKNRLFEIIHDSDSYATTNVIEVLVCNLRKKIAQGGGESVVKTRRGHGYYVD